MRSSTRALVLTSLALLTTLTASTAPRAQQAAPTVPNPTARDMFQLNDLASYRQFSTVKNFEVVGHSYFRGPWLVPGAPGAGFNTARICGTIAYFGGYNPTLFGALVVDVSNPPPWSPCPSFRATRARGTPISGSTATGRSWRSGTARARRTRTSRRAAPPCEAA